MPVAPHILVDPRCAIGENPLWHPDEGRLYWVDILAGEIWRCDPDTRAAEYFPAGFMVGGFTIQEDCSLLLFMEKGAIALWREGEPLEELRPGVEEGCRFNDVLADPEGRVLCGIVSLPVGQRPGRLCLLEVDGSLRTLKDGVIISNGLGFSPDGKWLYHADSLARKVYRYAYDARRGSISGEETWLSMEGLACVPDGLTVDAEGCVWLARWDGSCVTRHDPSGKEVARVEFPARKVTSLCFGGAGLDRAFATTALDGGTRDAEGVGAGALFEFAPGVRGLPEYRSRVRGR